MGSGEEEAGKWWRSDGKEDRQRRELKRTEKDRKK